MEELDELFPKLGVNQAEQWIQYKIDMLEGECMAPGAKPDPMSTLPGQWIPVNESMSNFSRAYQQFITGQTGMAYEVNGVRFDGVADTSYLDAKANYSQFVDGSGEFYGWWGGASDFVDQANRQIEAAGGQPIEWHFAQQDAAAATQSLFNSAGVSGITVVHTPYMTAAQ
ncbi:Tox-REase-5 domain-containing protein [Dyella humi]|uniref:Tox-REase-5 domain-containing protein n=1 Tax=Dyella humi TaxID=1770547 RepID=A0ABW8IGL9_9GAMM